LTCGDASGLTFCGAKEIKAVPFVDSLMRVHQSTGVLTIYSTDVWDIGTFNITLYAILKITREAFP
jgi:hypothetical protein